MKQAESFFYPDGKKDGTAPPPIQRQDSRIEGEICLLAESPYRILRVSVLFGQKFENFNFGVIGVKIIALLELNDTIIVSRKKILFPKHKNVSNSISSESSHMIVSIVQICKTIFTLFTIMLDGSEHRKNKNILLFRNQIKKTSLLTFFYFPYPINKESIVIG
ncbi:hypothetical protein WDU94_000692 [Cyamophila willieti]